MRTSLWVLAVRTCRTIAVVCLALILMLSSAVSVVKSAVNDRQPSENLAEPATPITVSLTINQSPLLGQPADLTCTVSSAVDAPGVTAQLELPTAAHLLKGEARWSGDLSAGQSVQFSATIVFEAGGDAAIFCRALRIIDEQNVWGDLAAVYVSIGTTESHSGFAPISREERDALGEVEAIGDGQVIGTATAYPAPIHNDPAGEPPGVEPHADAESLPPSSEPPTGDLTITGRWRFYGREDTVESEQMVVEIVRGDNSGHLAWCYTGSDGYYTCGPFTNPGGVGVRSRYLSYTSFNPYGDILVTINPNSGTVGNTDNAYAFTTSVQVFSDGTHDIGVWNTGSSNDNRRAYWVTDDLIKEWKYIYFSTGSTQSPQETSGQGTAEWKIDSTDGAYYSRGGNIHLKGEDPLSNTVVGHEYGHNMMWNIYGAWMPTTYCPSPHYVQLTSHVNCAWTEGWANFITLAANNDPVYRWASGGSLNLETPTWTSSGWDDGDDVEGRVAGALWDILDSVNEGDDQYSAGDLADIWDAIYHQTDSNFSEYWAAWKSRGHPNTSAGPVMSLYQNTIDYRGGPVHDDFANAMGIPSYVTGYGHYNVDTTNATTQGLDPATPCGSVINRKQSRSVWYKFSPTTTRYYTVTTASSNYDTVLGIWIGSWGALKNVACNNDGGPGDTSQIATGLYRGNTYYFEVMDFSSGTGGSLTFSFSSVAWSAKVYLPLILK